MRLLTRWFSFLILVGLVTGAVAGVWAFGLRDTAHLHLILPSLGALGAAVSRVSAGEPLPTDLLAAACLAPIPLLWLRDRLLDWQDRKRRKAVRALAARVKVD